MNIAVIKKLSECHFQKNYCNSGGTHSHPTKKTKMNTQSTITSSYHSKIRSSQNMGVRNFSCVYMEFGNISACFSESYNLSDLVDIQHEHEHGK